MRLYIAYGRSERSDIVYNNSESIMWRNFSMYGVAEDAQKGDLFARTPLSLPFFFGGGASMLLLGLSIARVHK